MIKLVVITESKFMPLQEAPYFRNALVKTLADTVYRSTPQDYYWEPNNVFDATIEIVGYVLKNISVVDVDTGTKYWIFPSYLLELVRLDVIRDSKVTGTWHVVKQGASVSIKLAY